VSFTFDFAQFLRRVQPDRSLLLLVERSRRLMVMSSAVSAAAIKILLVDDQQANLDVLDAILSNQDYDLLRADNAEAALRLLLEHDVAVVVLDIKMPDMNGLELAKIIKASKKFQQIPILFMTAHMVEDRDVIAGYGAGAVDYLTKPVNAQILRHKVAVFAELFRKNRALVEVNAQLKVRTVELEHTEAALRASVREKDAFVASLAHELRNPLTPLRVGLDILQGLGASEAPAGRALAAMSRQLDHMVRLIDDLLDLSRIRTGTFGLRKERVDLAELIQRAIEAAQPFFDQRTQAVAAAAHAPVFSVVDPVRILQILGNLLHNASKYAPVGGTIRVDLDCTPTLVGIRVIDNGVGIPAGNLERVFDMFTRFDRSLPGSDRGLGVGLTLSRKLATLHGGTLTASSLGEGRGTTFTLSLPVRSPADDVAVAPTRSTPGQDGVEGLDIVLIEDNKDLLEAFTIWLESLGHHVQSARTGPSGLALVQATRPQVVFCDLGLPEMDGNEVCQRIGAGSNDARPVMIALSGWVSEEDRKRTRSAGFDHHLAKPLEFARIRELLHSIAPRP
jgi:signal transduction histidine kinase